MAKLWGSSYMRQVRSPGHGTRADRELEGLRRGICSRSLLQTRHSMLFDTRQLLWLGVVACTGVRGEAGFIYLQLEAVILIRVFGRRRCERESVKGTRFVDAALN